ncbi:hypothetical protein HS088_TW03G00913 [Tripterygium wilfordii]|uniref:Uncharacterized protein n=1 Tax=Tripterygium wilfordii TaxID=458696 RepID=A0A7J7DWN5_TRIWF|nr:uncharacterized protein LOC119995654 [Tripterygium wilfordii]KAF5750574.1 hypothetical protein HS088_TW03G00913 [Tripterygium wilfordii]
MKGLSKIGISLTVVFVVCLLALIIDVLYVLWRRRSFQRRSTAVEYPEEQLSSPSKELLYFFCWKSQTRVEPDAVPRRTESGDDELVRWEKLYGPSRMLFTIKEEEREDDEFDHNSSSVENDARETRVCMEDVVVVVPDDVDDATPFSTPCASPPYYTPSPSPSHITENITAVEDLV